MTVVLDPILMQIDLVKPAIWRALLGGAFPVLSNEKV
jgi:hypothetical protein